VPYRTRWLKDSVLVITFSGDVDIEQVAAATDEITVLADQQSLYVLCDFTSMQSLSTNIIAAVSQNRIFMRMVRHEQIGHWVFVKPSALARTAIQIFIPRNKAAIVNNFDDATRLLESVIPKG
jgi:hypothetical protein